MKEIGIADAKGKIGEFEPAILTSDHLAFYAFGHAPKKARDNWERLPLSLN